MLAFKTRTRARLFRIKAKTDLLETVFVVVCSLTAGPRLLWAGPRPLWAGPGSAPQARAAGRGGRGVTMGSKMAAATRVVQVTAGGVRPGEGVGGDGLARAGSPVQTAGFASLASAEA